MKKRMLNAAVLVGSLLSTLPAMAEFRAEATSEKQSNQIRAIQDAVAESLRLKDSCSARDPRLCDPEPPCDAQGQRPEPWQGCVLAWVPDAAGKEQLSWVDEWKIHNFHYRRPMLNADGSLD